MFPHTLPTANCTAIHLILLVDSTLLKRRSIIIEWIRPRLFPGYFDRDLLLKKASAWQKTSRAWLAR